MFHFSRRVIWQEFQPERNGLQTLQKKLRGATTFSKRQSLAGLRSSNFRSNIRTHQISGHNSFSAIRRTSKNKCLSNRHFTKMTRWLLSRVINHSNIDEYQQLTDIKGSRVFKTSYINRHTNTACTNFNDVILKIFFGKKTF